jgi:hypothetical protein
VRDGKSRNPLALAVYCAKRVWRPSCPFTFEDCVSIGLSELLMYPDSKRPLEYVIIDEIRKWNTRSAKRPVSLRSGLGVHSPDWVGAMDRSEAVAVALARLSKRDRSVWWLIANGYAKQEVAKRFNRSPAWVSLVLRRTRGFLRDCLLMALA